MQYKTLLNSTKKFSTLCLGTMTFGTQNTKEESFSFMDYAVDVGINHIDTAELYPVPATSLDTLYLTEKYIGEWLQQSNVDRDTLNIVSKVMGPASDRPARPQNNPLTRESIIASLDGSLSRLGTEYLDVYLVHWPMRNTNLFGKLGYVHKQEDFDVEAQILSVIQTMNDLIQQGKILHYGLSNETAWGIMKYIQLADKHGLIRPATVQNPYSLLNRSYEVGCAEIAMREGIGLMSYAGLANGTLSGKHLNGIQPDTRMSIWPENFQRYENPQSDKARKAYVDLAHDIGISPTTLAIAFILNQPFVDCSITGNSKVEQLQEWVDACGVKLNEDVLQRIEDIHKVYTYPCP